MNNVWALQRWLNLLQATQDELLSFQYIYSWFWWSFWLYKVGLGRWLFVSALSFWLPEASKKPKQTGLKGRVSTLRTVLGIRLHSIIMLSFLWRSMSTILLPTAGKVLQCTYVRGNITSAPWTARAPTTFEQQTEREKKRKETINSRIMSSALTSRILLDAI